ncbi:MAG: hypothetical protein IKT29_07755 [Flavobacteriales bacterium]|nr:hypothetical protein [Flavobacteriales bacterium]
MKRFTYILVLLSIIFTSCNKDGGQESIAKRTTLIYMAGDNDLSSFADDNTQSIIDACKTLNHLTDINLLIYKDTQGKEPQLLYIDNNGSRIIKEYPGEISSSQRGLSLAIQDMIKSFTADTYSLVLWSHGTAWLPANFTLVHTSSMATLYTVGGVAYPPTKTFGHQVVNNTTYEIELDELKRTIPTGVFDYIVFDACYMGAVEVAYALRDKAQYIVASPCEIIADGFPYKDIVGELTSYSTPIEGICTSIARKYFNYYSSHTDPSYRYATVSVIRTSALEGLSSAVSGIVKSHTAEINTLKENSAQILDNYSRHFAYDLDSYMGLISSQSQYHTFTTALNDAVVYKASTAYMFNQRINTFCGLSSYIPLSSFSSLNTYYSLTEWYRDTYL